MRDESGVCWKFEGTHPETKRGPGFQGIVRSRSQAGRLRCDSIAASKGKAKEDKDVESLESVESRHGHHDTSVSPVKEFGNVGRTPSAHTH